MCWACVCDLGTLRIGRFEVMRSVLEASVSDLGTLRVHPSERASSTFAIRVSHTLDLRVQPSRSVGPAFGSRECAGWASLSCDFRALRYGIVGVLR